MSIENILTLIADAMEKQTLAINCQTEAINKLTTVFLNNERTKSTTITQVTNPVTFDKTPCDKPEQIETTTPVAEISKKKQAADSDRITKEQLRALIAEFTEKHEDARQQLRGMMLSVCKVTKLPDIKEEDYGRFYQEIKYAMEA